MAYASDAWLDLYGIVLILDGYSTHFKGAMSYDDDYYMQNTSVVELCEMLNKLGF